MFDELIGLFQPGYRHLTEERERQQLTIAYPEDGAPPFGIDLDAGIAVITRDGSAAIHRPSPASPATPADDDAPAARAGEVSPGEQCP